MSEPKFTKGPWKWQDEEEYGIVVHAEHSPIAMVICEEDKANATLIAAAPDMYEALEFQCKNCLGRYSISKDSNECALYIRGECMIAKALRKARGEKE